MKPFYMGDKYMLTPSNLRELDLSENINLGLPIYQALARVVEDRIWNLKSLNLEANKCGDDACELICEAISYNDSITYLNLSKNNISDRGAKAIAGMLS